MKSITRRIPWILCLLVPLLIGGKCKKEPEPEPDVTTPDVVSPPEVELQVVSIDPAGGTAKESFDARVYGSDFQEGARVLLGDIEASRVEVQGETTIQLTVPALSTGTWDVTVINPDGERAVLRRGLTISEPVVTANCSELTVYFDFDESDLESDALSLLGRKADCLSDNRGTIRIEGHCDARGTTEYNVALGERRAYAVQRYLVSQGISPSRIVTISYGEERPAVRGSGEAAWSKNRRAEISLQD